MNSFVNALIFVSASVLADYGSYELAYRDVHVEYEEKEYNIEYKIETEQRTRQVPVVCSHELVETRYANETEERYTTQYEVKYRPNIYARHSFEPRTEVGTYQVPQFRDVPVVSFET